MLRLRAGLAVAAMLFAVVAAPFFHIHEDDHDDHAGSTVHAHFEESDHESHSPGPGVAAPPTHEQIRWLSNIFSTDSPIKTSSLAVAEIVERADLLCLPLLGAFIPIRNLRAHSPPERGSSVPRSPPTP